MLKTKYVAECLIRLDKPQNNTREIRITYIVRFEQIMKAFHEIERVFKGNNLNPLTETTIKHLQYWYLLR